MKTPDSTTQGRVVPSALADCSPFWGAQLTIEYHRICPSDKSGTIDIDCDGPAGWHYADLGCGRGAQVCEGVDETKVLAFGDALARLVREHFGRVRPLLDHDVGRRRANAEAESRRDAEQPTRKEPTE